MCIENMIKNDLVVSIHNLSKTFGDFRALEDLEININKGEIFGLIGPNGSGKTTTINILLGLLKADHGAEIKIFGYNIPLEMPKVFPFIGYMPQDISLYMDLSIIQNLRFFANLYDINSKNKMNYINEILELVDLTEFKNRQLNKCSGGMQRRTSLAVALLHKPKLLILDEPTVGVDPDLRYVFWEYFKKISKEKGVSILITTHYLAESVKCDKIGFINKKIIKYGIPLDLQNELKTKNNASKLPDMEEVFMYWNHKHKKVRDLGGNV